MSRVELGRAGDRLLYIADVPSGLPDLDVHAAWRDALALPRDTQGIADRMALNLPGYRVDWRILEGDDIAYGIAQAVRAILLTISRE